MNSLETYTTVFHHKVCRVYLESLIWIECNDNVCNVGVYIACLISFLQAPQYVRFLPVVGKAM